MSGRSPKFGDWVMVRHLGKGTYGEVTLWRNEKTEQQVAVKRCPLLTSDADEKKYKMKERWEKELGIMQGELRNEFLVSAVRVDSKFLNALNNPKTSILPALVMEFCDGGDLRSLLYDIKNSNGLSEIEVKNVLRTLGGAISYLHAYDITHRDLKPENIVIKKGPDGNIFKVTDFGYAKDIAETNSNSQVGTNGYFAPEIILKPKYSKTVDFWSMGIVAFEVICGINPFIPHQILKTWIENVTLKSQETIAITETKDNKFEEHNRIFDENQITSLFRGMIESWLKVALDIDPKRGLSPGVFEGPNDLRSISFFTHLERILNKKILTIFCLSTYTFLDYEVTENTSITELLIQIERDTNIPLCKIYLILTSHDRINYQIQKNTKAMDLIVDNIDGPMLYVCRVPPHLLDTQNLLPGEPPNAIADVLDSTNQAFQKFYILEVARKMLYFARNENRHYVQLLKGIHAYAMFLNHQIRQFESSLEKINEQNILGALENCLCLRNHSKLRLKNKKTTHFDLSAWEAKENRIQEEIQKLVDACAKIRHRYKSVLRRSIEIIDFQLLKDTDQDFFDVKEREKLYSSLREERGNPFQISSPDRTHSLVNVYYEIVQRRGRLLQDPRILQVQKQIAGVHEEFGKILQITNDASDQIKKYSGEIKRLTCECLDDVWRIVEETAEESKNIPDLDSIMSSLKIDQNQNGVPTLNFQIGPIQSPSSQMDVCSLIDYDTKSIVEQNELLMQSLQMARADFCFPGTSGNSP